MAMPTWVSAGNSGLIVATTGSTLTIAIPGSIVQGDLLGIVFAGSCPTPNEPDVTLPSGWTWLVDAAGFDSLGRIFVMLRDARAAADESGNFPDFTVSTLGTGGVVGGISFALRGMPPTAFTEGAATTTGTGLLVEDADCTTAGPNRLVVSFVIQGAGNTLAEWQGATGGTWVQQMSDPDTAGGDVTIMICTANMAAAGTIGGGTDTVGGPGFWASYSVAFLPALSFIYPSKPAALSALLTS